jgi:hypothetical protein
MAIMLRRCRLGSARNLLASPVLLQSFCRMGAYRLLSLFILFCQKSYPDRLRKPSRRGEMGKTADSTAGPEYDIFFSPPEGVRQQV